MSKVNVKAEVESVLGRCTQSTTFTAIEHKASLLESATSQCAKMTRLGNITVASHGPMIDLLAIRNEMQEA